MNINIVVDFGRRPTAHWIVTRIGQYYRNKCSRCGKHIDSDDNCIIEEYAYCPFCGAKMVAK